MELIIVTGISGAGKSKTLDLLEDIGYYCVDNIPPDLIPKFAELCRGQEGGMDKVAIGADVRTVQNFQSLRDAIAAFSPDVHCRVILVDASTSVLIKRFQETRRKHPLAGKVDGPIEDLIKYERRLLEPMFSIADFIIDTSTTTTAQLWNILIAYLLGRERELEIQIVSFGYRGGLPPEADMVFDMRCLENPYYVDELRDLTGLDGRIERFVLGADGTMDYLGRILDLVRSKLPRFAREGRGTLVLGTSADYAPYEFMYADDSGTMQYAGIDISAGQYIADELGKELQVENMSFDYLLTSLAKGDFDIVMAAIEVTPKRLQSADFSDPYYTDLPAMILVKADAADQYNTLADFAGKSVGAQTATTKEAIVTDQMEGANLVSLSLVTDLVNELVYGKVDAIVVDGAVAEQYAEANPDLAIAPASSELGEAQPYCIAVAKGDPKGLLPGINEAIAKMTSENKMEAFIAAADELSGKAVEVTADAPAA